VTCRHNLQTVDADQLDGTGKSLVVGNGYAKERQVTTGAGMVEVKAPRVYDRRQAIVPVRSCARLHAQVPQSDRGTARAVPPGPVDGRLRPRSLTQA
jgi:hypothetical protein